MSVTEQAPCRINFHPPGVPAEHLPIYRLEAELRKLPQYEFPITEEFCDGLYARTMHMPADSLATGAVHSRECFLVVQSGEVLLTTDAGAVRLGPGSVVKSGAGTKRAAYAVTDCALTTFHPNPTNERDRRRLWEIFTQPAPVMELTP